MKIKVLNIDQELVNDSVRQIKEVLERFYVYIHRKISDNKPFYIGKGTGYRCLTIYKRSKHWLNVANKHGVYVQIYKNKLTSEQACLEEIVLIKKLGIKKLSNISLGGESGLVGKTNHMYGVQLFGELNGNFGNKGYKNPLSKPILCFDLEGNFVKEYESANQSEEDGFSATTVIAVCNKRRKQHKNFLFIKKSDYNSEIKLVYKKGKTDRKKVYHYDLNNNFIRSYDSVSETEKFGFNPKKVSAVCLGKNKTHNSMKFSYVQYKI